MHEECCVLLWTSTRVNNCTNILPSLQLYAPYHWWRLDILQYPLILHQSANFSDKHWARILCLRTANIFSAFFFLLKFLFFCHFSSCVSVLYIMVVTSVLKLSLVKTTLAAQKDMWEKQLFFCLTHRSLHIHQFLNETFKIMLMGHKKQNKLKLIVIFWLLLFTWICVLYRRHSW